MKPATSGASFPAKFFFSLELGGEKYWKNLHHYNGHKKWPLTIKQTKRTKILKNHHKNQTFLKMVYLKKKQLDFWPLETYQKNNS